MPWSHGSRLFLAATVTALTLTPPARAQAPVRIRMGTLAPQGTSYHRILQEMGERWRTATNGQVQTTIYAGTMGSEAELVRRMRLGQLQAAAITGVGLALIDPAVAALQTVPMLFRTLDELDYARGRMEPVITRRLAAQGVVLLFWSDAGWVRYFMRQQAVRPDEFRRFKMLVTAGETDQFDLMRSAGYQPVALEWADALTSLQTGMIDAIPTLPYFALTMQFHTVTKYMLNLDWAPLLGALVINKTTWDALGPERQAALREIAVASGRQFQARARAEGEEAVTAMQQRGLTVVPVPPAAQAEWRATAEGLYPRIRGSMVPADMFDEVQRILTEYRAQPRPAR
jgi:TRAP-type C4-dicarboxylate transport system substrate-binding protein